MQPVKDWCEQGDLNFQNKTEPTTSLISRSMPTLAP